MARDRHYRTHGADRQWVFVATTCPDFDQGFPDLAMRDVFAAS